MSTPTPGDTPGHSAVTIRETATAFANSDPTDLTTTLQHGHHLAEQLENALDTHT
ncbi:Uncharacterised protein [Dermatophilus congolensis]|uniref:Uncharacterized protein n=1 Tax=Dermatophilus congolensis TaxID=1863 RepID=A0AA46BM78_9MICO|nr:hypothetical protein [Dermatophilus congolensis]STD06235.1 Uncharacterised protein [Dermatophilus congolensis]